MLEKYRIPANILLLAALCQQPATTAATAAATTRPAIYCIAGSCSSKQTTTNLLLFVHAGSGEEPDARITKHSSLSELKASGFSAGKPTVLLVHGFRGSGLSHQRWAIDMKDLILAKGERANVFYADWSHHARVISYIYALEHTSEVTEDLWQIFDKLEAAFPSRFKMTEIHVIGHSLGAHIAGLLGQMMNRQLDQITALDPTGIMLNSAEANLKLSQDDAKYVSALHTNAKILGTELNLADRDVFFNGGSDQPACKSIAATGLIPAGCSHRQAVKYASVFMNKCVMVAYLCKDYETFLAGQCGFCPANSAACVAVGNEWQYAAHSGPLRPPKYDKKKSKGDRPWLQPGPTTPRYHIRMGADRPYCLFTYQVVVKFADNSDRLDRLQSIDLVLRHQSLSNNRTSAPLWVHLNNRLRPDARLEVFSGAPEAEERRETIFGRYLFTGLASVDRAHELYDEMPIKFTEVGVVRSAAGNSNKQQEQLEKPEVYVNFMSHPRFEVRATNSGQVERVGFINLEQANKSGREPRIESRMDGAADGFEAATAAAKRLRDLKRGWSQRWTQVAG